MRRAIVNIAFIIFCFALQICIFPFLPFLSASPNLLIILTFSYGFTTGVKEGMMYGMICGILMDLFHAGSFGFFTLLFIWVGYLNGKLSYYFYEDYIALPLAVCALNEVFYNILIYFFRFFVRGKMNILFYIKSIVLPEVMITLIFTLLLYRFLLEYNRKLNFLDSKRS